MFFDTPMFASKKRTYANTWTQVQSLPMVLYYHEFVSLANGSVLSVGGAWGWQNLECTSNCYRYDPGGNAWTQVASRPIAHCQGASTRLANGCVLSVAGFYDTTNITANCYIYDPVLNSWAATTALPAQRQMGWLDLMANGSVIYYNSANVTAYTSTTYIRDTSGNWTTGNAEPIAYNQSAGCPLSNGSHLIVAGTNGGSPGTGLTANCYLYSEASGTWSSFTSYPLGSCLMAAIELDDLSILSVGGIQNTTACSNLVYRYTPNTGTWTAARGYPLTTGVAGPGIAKLANGSVLVGGGESNSGFYSACYRYD